MSEEAANARCSTPVSCWLSSAPVQLSVGFGFGLKVSGRVQLPNKRCKRCRGDVSNSAAVLVVSDTASPERVGGLAWELQKVVESYGDVRGQLERGGEPIDRDFYARWLKSKGSLDEAETCIRAHAAWREAFVTRGRIQEDEISGELAARKAFLQGCDREGHPVLVVLAARHDMGDRSIAETKRFICYCLDNTIASADFSRNPRGQIRCLFDLSGLRPRNLDVKALQAVFELLQSHYPERLHALWFLNAPFIFWGVWRMVRPFIRTEETKSKIVFLSGSTRQAALNEHISAEVLPKVYGGNAELVPAEEAALKRLMQHERKQSKQAAKCKALKAEAARSSRIASAGRAVSRWSSSAWGVAKKPAVVAWAHLPHWQHMPRIRFRQSSKPGTASRTSTLARTLSRHLSVRRPLFSMRQRSKRPSSHGAKDRPLLQKMLNPMLILEVFRLLTISAAQALYWAWSHAIPIRLQRPQGGLPRLQSAAPEAATGSVLLRPEAVRSSSFAPFAQSAAAIEASAPCSSVAQFMKENLDAHGDPGPQSQVPHQPYVAGNDVEVSHSLNGHNQQECSIGSEAAVAEQRAGKVCFDEAPPQTAIVEYPSKAAGPECTQVALQQHTLLLILLGGILLIGLMMLLPELTAYPGNTQSRMMVTLI